MVAVGVDLHVELLAGLYEGLAILGGVAQVDVVVGRAVDEQEVARELRCAADGVVGIALAVFLRRAHVALGVDGVVVAPVGRGCHGHSGAEDGLPGAHRHERVEAAKAPTPNAYVLAVDVGQRGKIAGGGSLVLGFEAAQVQVGTLLESRPAATRAASVNADVDVAARGHVALVNASAEKAHVPRVGDLLRAGPGILIHDDGIAARGVEVGRLDHPSVQLGAVDGLKGEKLLLPEAALELRAELLVVDKGGEQTAVGVAQGGDGGLLGRGIDVHVVFERGGEGGIVRADGVGELANLAVLVGDVDSLAQGALLARCVVAAAGLGVVAVEVGDVVVAAGELAHELAAEGVKINVVVAAAVGDVGEMAGVELQRAVGRLLDILVGRFAHGELAHGRAGVGHVDVHLVLAAVERDDGQLVGLRRKGDAGHVAVLVERQIELPRDAVFDVEREDGHLRVFRSGHGIFIGVGPGIFAVLLHGGCGAAVEGEAVKGHVGLVVAHPGQHAAVGAERKGAVEGELLLVDPVGDAVEHLAALAVLGHTALGVAKEELDEVDVVIAHEGDEVAVGREDGHLLRPAVGEGLHLVVLDVVDVIDSREGAAVDGARLGLDEDAPAVGREDVAVDGRKGLGPAGGGGVEEGFDLLARLEGMAHDALSVGREARVGLAVGHGPHAVDVGGRVGAVGDVFQAERGVLSLCAADGRKPAGGPEK